MFFSINLYANIIYDKNNVIISEIDLNYYNQLYFENFGKKLNKPTAIKNIVVIKKFISNLEKNNPYLIKKIDEILIKEYGSDKIDVQIFKDFLRYFKIKNEYIIEFYNTKFNINDLKNIFSQFKKIELPISKNNCLTIIKLMDFKENNFFLNNFYENLRKKTEKYEVKIDNELYDVCIDLKTYKVFEQNILNYIDLKTEDDFKISL